MGLRQIDHGSKEYRQMVSLRNKILREPLGLKFSQEELDKEKDDIHIAAFEDDELLGCCILSRVDKQTFRLRQMAVLENNQHKGIGASLLNYVENIARDRGATKIMMHSRATAVGFYSKMGYKLYGEPFMELGIPHRFMQKVINTFNHDLS